ncbi:hypothetical protein [Halorussus halobius]|uniref:hypothetical protein n=1 Tax=Halorussus halobius TaxID=1710537 RepID=UPI0010920E40|nr:hypothetical protein [Halorussus halobius]
MVRTALIDPLVRYSLLAAIVTVTAAYLVVGTGLPLVVLAVAGSILVVLGAGETDEVPASAVAGAERGGEVDTVESGALEGIELTPRSSPDHSLPAKVLFYGVGLVVWDVVGIAMLMG